MYTKTDQWQTYAPPKAKTTMRAIFDFLFSSSWFRKGRGNTATAISVKILIAALENLVIVSPIAQIVCGS